MEEDDENENEHKVQDDMDVDEKRQLVSRSGDMDVDGCHHQRGFSEKNKLVKNIGMVVRNLRSLGLTSMVEDAYASAIYFLLKVTSCYTEYFRIEYFLHYYSIIHV